MPLGFFDQTASQEGPGQEAAPKVRAPGADREAFTAFEEPGYAKAAMSMLVRAEGRGCRLITETRIRTTDAGAARSFRRYWRLVRPGSGLIRRSWLAAVRRRVEAGKRGR